MRARFSKEKDARRRAYRVAAKAAPTRRIEAEEPGSESCDFCAIRGCEGQCRDWETCESCGKAKPDVRERIDGYIADVQNREVLHTAVCDECEQKGCDDI